MLEALNPALLLGCKSALLSTHKKTPSCFILMSNVGVPLSFFVWLVCGQEPLGFSIPLVFPKIKASTCGSQKGEPKLKQLWQEYSHSPSDQRSIYSNILLSLNNQEADR